MRATFSQLSLLLVAALVGLSEGYNGCPDQDPMDHTVHLPHPTDCTLFYRCDHGYPKLDRCPAGLHFNPSLQVCDWPDQAGCTAGEAPISTPEPERTTSAAPWTCSSLPRSEVGTWSPPSCVETSSTLNDVCRLTCDVDFALSGGSVARCTEHGWAGVNGLNQIPDCKEIADLGSEFVARINKTLHGRRANMLFLLDESGSLHPSEFNMEVEFMQAIVAAFPLGDDRSAGAITFETSSMVDIPINTNDTCSFMDQADLIRYSSGGTNILGALQLAISEVVNHAVHNFTLVFLITDGVSYSDPQSAADHMKQHDFALFTVGIGSFNPEQLRALASRDEAGVPIFFPIENFGVFQKVADYLDTIYSIGALNCGSTPNPGTVGPS